ncbi:MAG: hypothetical protein JSV09_03485 [Thermoplasmata archaeon]|nr:MAG: hypothetical protein JSV09_03485 [Thermoplasmata archaeon]
MVICECGDTVGKDKFKDYIKTSTNPSTKTFSHSRCGFIFNFVDNYPIGKYSSKVKLKVIAKEFEEKVNMSSEETGKLLLEVDRLKRNRNLPDFIILRNAYESISEMDPFTVTESVICFMMQKKD